MISAEGLVGELTSEVAFSFFCALCSCARRAWSRSVTLRQSPATTPDAGVASPAGLVPEPTARFSFPPNVPLLAGVSNPVLMLPMLAGV